MDTTSAEADARTAEADAKKADAEAKKAEAEAVVALAKQVHSESAEQFWFGCLERAVGLVIVTTGMIDGTGLADFPFPDSQLVALIGIGVALLGRVPGTLGDLFRKGLSSS